MGASSDIPEVVLMTARKALPLAKLRKLNLELRNAAADQNIKQIFLPYVKIALCILQASGQKGESLEQVEKFVNDNLGMMQPSSNNFYL